MVRIDPYDLPDNIFDDTIITIPSSQMIDFTTSALPSPLQPPRRAAGVLVLRDGPSLNGLVLGILKSRNQELGIPCGKVDPGETVVQAAIRELYEETGLVAESRYLRGPLLVDESDSEHYEVTVYLATRLQTENLQISAEGIPVWTTWDRLLTGVYSQFNRKLYAAYLDYVQDLQTYN